MFYYLFLPTDILNQMICLPYIIITAYPLYYK